MKLDDGKTLRPEEHSTILAALRHYQQGLQLNGDVPPQDVYDIATNSDAHSPLNTDQIDDLCERLNGG